MTVFCNWTNTWERDSNPTKSLFLRTRLVRSADAPSSSDYLIIYVLKAAPSLPEFNELAMAQLEAMGFPTIRCQKALLATGNSDPNAAMEWLFQHMEDPGELTII